MGVFATRSPFRPNPIGLSSVKLLRLEETKNEGTVLIISGADLMDGTPIYDIKPYLAYTDSHPDAVGGFSDDVLGYKTEVIIPEEYAAALTDSELAEIRELLEHDPRPSYQNDGEREYGMTYGTHEVHFRAEDDVITVTGIE